MEQTRNDLIGCLGDANATAPKLKKMPIRRFYQAEILPYLPAGEKNRAESIYQQYLTKSSEIKKSLKASRQIAVRMLLSLLSREQRKIYYKEHPRRTPAKKVKGTPPPPNK